MQLNVFDLDHTLLSVNSSYQFGKYLYRQGYYSFASLTYCLSCYALHKAGCLTVPQLHRTIFHSIFHGREMPELARAADSFLEEHLPQMLYAPVLERLQEAQKQGQPVVILSSAPDFLVKPIASRLQVKLWEATRYAVNGENRLYGIISVLQGKDKAYSALRIAMEMNMPREAIVVYSDSYLDLPLLEVAGRAVGVNPDRKLRALCQRKGWNIL